MSKSKDLEDQMRGKSINDRKTVLDEDDEPSPKKAKAKRKLRSINFERAEGGFTGRADFEPEAAKKSSKGEPTQSPMYESPKPHVFKNHQEMSDFMKEHWDDASDE